VLNTESRDAKLWQSKMEVERSLSSLPDNLTMLDLSAQDTINMNNKIVNNLIDMLLRNIRVATSDIICCQVPHSLHIDCSSNLCVEIESNLTSVFFFIIRKLLLKAKPS
jgi:hypothetical protein